MKTTAKKSLPAKTEDDIRGWLPEVGEWYSLTENAKMFVFDNHEMAMAYYRNTHTMRDKILNILDSDKWIFITNVTILKDNPALIDFMIKSEVPQKIYTLPLFPPRDLSHPRIWEAFLVKESK